MTVIKSKVFSIASSFLLLGGVLAAAGESSEMKSKEAVFKGYEKLSEALAADDRDEAMASARALAILAEVTGQKRTAELAGEVAAAEDFDGLRETFVPLSGEIIMLAAGNDDYFVMGCPMVENGRWLQRDDQVRNPYMGQRMINCGDVVTKTAELELSPCCEERRSCCDQGGDCCPIG